MTIDTDALRQHAEECPFEDWSSDTILELLDELDRLRAMTPAGVVELLEERNSLLAENRRLRGGWQAVRDDGPDATLMVKP